MLVCNVSLRPPARMVAADLAEAAVAGDLVTVGIGLGALLDEPVSASDTLNAFVGQVLVEAASASDAVDAGSIYGAAINEPVAAVDTPDGAIGISYATWDAATVSSVTLSGGDLVATNTGTTSANQGARVASAGSKSSGKYYFEATWTTITTGGNFAVGIGTTASTYTNMGNSATTGTIIYRSGDIAWNGGSVGTTLGAFSAGEIVGIAVDFDTLHIWFRRAPSGNWNNSGTANPATGAGWIAISSGAQVPFCTFGGTGGAVGNVLTVNFGASAFTGAVPSGFTSGWLAPATVPSTVSADVVEAATATDDPSATVTSAPAFATWDSTTVTAVTLSGGDLVATNTGTTSANQGAHVASSAGKTSGKYYFEITLGTQVAGGNRGVAIGTTASTYTNMGNSATTGCNMYVSNGNIWANGISASRTIGNRSAGNVIGMAVDLDNRKIWYRVAASGNWNGQASDNPDTNTGGVTIPAGTMVPFCTFGGSLGAANNVFTANFGASAFTGAVPSGFTAGWPP